MAKPKKGCATTNSETLGLGAIILIAVYFLTDNDHTREVVLSIASIVICFWLLYVSLSVILKNSNIKTRFLQNMAGRKELVSRDVFKADESKLNNGEAGNISKNPSSEEDIDDLYNKYSSWLKPRRFTILTHTNNDVIKNVSTKYDFTDISYVVDPDGLPPKYLLIGTNKEKATQDILALNGFLDIARDYAPSFPVVQISEETLLFDPPTNPLETFNFCCLQANVFTEKTKKLSKYPVSLYFSNSSRASYRISGSIDYFADGEVGKIQIFGWQKDERFELHCKTNIYDFLELRKIVYNGNTVYKSELSDVQIPNSSEYKNIPKHQPKTEQRIVTHYEEETVFYTLSDTEIEDIQSVIEYVFNQFDIPSKVLTYRIEQEYTEFDISVPEGVRLKKLLSFRDEIDIRIPKTTVDMLPDYERGVVVIRAKHRAEQVMVQHEDVVKVPIYEKKQKNKALSDKKSVDKEVYNYGVS